MGGSWASSVNLSVSVSQPKFEGAIHASLDGNAKDPVHEGEASSMLRERGEIRSDAQEIKKPRQDRGR